MSRLFEPFFTTKEYSKGTGLGLAICRSAIQELGGEIDVESSLGEGTTFTITLPMDESGEYPARAEPTPELGSLRGSETILVVEDDAIVARCAQRALLAHGFKVLVASDRRGALELFEAQRTSIDLVLCDVRLGHDDGYEIARQLAHGTPQLRVLMTTGYFEAETSGGGAELPVMLKPYAPAQLVQRVRRCLDDSPDNDRAPPARGRPFGDG